MTTRSFFCFLNMLISTRNRNHKRKYFSIWMRGRNGLESWETWVKNLVTISPFRDTCLIPAVTTTIMWVTSRRMISRTSRAALQSLPKRGRCWRREVRPGPLHLQPSFGLWRRYSQLASITKSAGLSVWRTGDPCASYGHHLQGHCQCCPGQPGQPRHQHQQSRKRTEAHHQCRCDGFGTGLDQWHWGEWSRKRMKCVQREETSQGQQILLVLRA